MFTGLTEAMGTVVAAVSRGGGLALRIECEPLAPELSVGESVAVDGCCLTVETSDSEGFDLFASPETLAKTTLGERVPSSVVNLERALALGDRLGGHLVTGHIDGLGAIERIDPLGEAWRITVRFPENLAPLLVERGSIAVDGISLTTFDVTDDAFTVAIIPETWRKTTLQQRRPGDRVHLEADLIGKYVARQLALRQSAPQRGITEEDLRRAGFIADPAGPA